MKLGKNKLWSCIDLRPFSPTKSDYGVKDYLAMSQCDNVIFLNFYVDFLHTHDGADDTFLNAMSTANRGMPWHERWTRKDFRNLIQVLKENGAGVYLGLLSMTKSDRWNEETDWVHQHPELYQTLRDGNLTWGKAVNPLKRFRSGDYYEDLFVKDLARVLEDYAFDGVCLGDGMLGLRGPRQTLDDSDFSEDMLNQFGEWLDEDPRSAEYVLESLRPQWSEFWCQRWETFVAKTAAVTIKQGKGLIALDAWSRHPIDLYIDFGIDYNRLGKQGLQTVMVQAREANKWRKHKEGTYATEGAMLATFLAHKVRAPNVEFCWAMPTVNDPELWNAILDLPNLLEREGFGYLTQCYYDGHGWTQLLDGVCLIWGNMSAPQDWAWCHALWDKSNQSVKRATQPLGVVYVGESFTGSACFSQHALPEACRALIDSGLPMHAACSISDLPNLLKEEHGPNILFFASPARQREFQSLLPEGWLSLSYSDQSYMVDQTPLSDPGEVVQLITAQGKFGSDAGRIYGFADNEDNYLVAIENGDNLFYRETTVSVPALVNRVKCLPPRERYFVTQSIKDNNFAVSVPPDGILIVEIKTNSID